VFLNHGVGSHESDIQYSMVRAFDLSHRVKWQELFDVKRLVDQYGTFVCMVGSRMTDSDETLKKVSDFPHLSIETQIIKNILVFFHHLQPLERSLLQCLPVVILLRVTQHLPDPPVLEMMETRYDVSPEQREVPITMMAPRRPRFLIMLMNYSNTLVRINYKNHH